METIDLAKQFKEQYSAKQQPNITSVDKASYLAVKGKGECGGKEFQKAIESIYTVAYTMKFSLKGTGAPDFKISKLECLYHIEGDPGVTPQTEWRWTFLVRMPDFITKQHVKDAALSAKKKGKDILAVNLVSIKEGNCLQALHIGPYTSISESYKMLETYAGENGMALQCPCHEIYLNDPRRTAPEKLKTIVRFPFKKK